MNAAKVLIPKNWREAKPKKGPQTRENTAFEQLRVIKSEDLPELLSTREAAGFLKKHPDTIREYRYSGLLKFRKVRGRYFTTPEWIAQFLNEEDKNR